VEKKMRLFLVLCMTLLCAGFCFAEDPTLGFWLSVDEKTGKTTAGWEIYQEKNGLLFGLRQEKEGQWSGGNIINPEDGNMYKCKIIFHKANGTKYKTDTLEMRGEIGLGIGCSQFWRKATRAEASALK
jgi:uncharacterized protein (DUF2147 family)